MCFVAKWQRSHHPESASYCTCIVFFIGTGIGPYFLVIFEQIKNRNEIRSYVLLSTFVGVAADKHSPQSAKLCQNHRNKREI